MNAVVERHVVLLVNTFNNLGLVTRASCHGHGFLIARAPFVVFAASESVASKLSKALRDDAEASYPALYWGWHIDAGFDQNHKLFFRMTTENPHRRIYRINKHWLNRDLMTLSSLVESTVQQIDRSDTT